MTLVCFAVKEEAAPFKELLHEESDVKVLLTGVGVTNAERAIHRAIKNERPGLLLSCGFAGGLNLDLRTGDVVFSTSDSRLGAALQTAGAVAARFHCAEKIATTVFEKRQLRQETGADTVEMESRVIAEICREQNIPCATVRVVLDAANEDLPLDFNALMNARQEIDFAKLAFVLLKSPGKIPALIRLQGQSRRAAETLAQVLEKIIPR